MHKNQVYLTRNQQKEHRRRNERLVNRTINWSVKEQIKFNTGMSHTVNIKLSGQQQQHSTHFYVRFFPARKIIIWKWDEPSPTFLHFIAIWRIDTWNVSFYFNCCVYQHQIPCYYVMCLFRNIIRTYSKSQAKNIPNLKLRQLFPSKCANKWANVNKSEEITNDVICKKSRDGTVNWTIYALTISVDAWCRATDKKKVRWV